MIALSVEKKERGKYKITTDDDVIIYLYYKEVKALEIKANEEIKEESWQKAMALLFTRGKKRVYHLLGRQDYTRNDIRKKLKKDGYTPELVEKIVDYFEEKGFIDDQRYMEKYYEYHKSQKSQRIITMKLREKGVDQNMIKEFFGEMDTQEQEVETAKRHLIKKFGKKEVTRDDYMKMIRFLTYKGFNYDVCKTLVNDFLKGVHEEMF